MKKNLLLSLLFFIFYSFSQPVVKDTLIASNDFEENFYEAIKHKSIENYDRAIVSLEKCVNKNEDEIVFFELGKNYFALKDLDKAYEYFEKSHNLNPKERWYLDNMYQINRAKRDYKTAEINLNKLVEIKKEYKEELLTLYMITNQYSQAKVLIEELDATMGKDRTREKFKKDLAVLEKPNNDEKTLLDAIKNSPKEEQNYIQLMYLYSEKGNDSKVIEIADLLKDNLPNSNWAHVSLFKIYLDNKEINQAKESLYKIISNKDFDTKIRHKMLNEFLVFVQKNKTNYEDLEKAVSYFSEDKIPVTKEVGKFFQNKNEYEIAYIYYQKQYNNNPDDIENLSLLLQMLEVKKDYNLLEKITLENLDKYPMQPELYYYKSVFNAGKNNNKNAIESLNEGFDFIIDNKNLEIMFYKQYIKIYTLMNDSKNTENYTKKLNLLKS